MLTIRDLKKSVGGRTLFENAAMTINYGERVALAPAREGEPPARVAAPVVAITLLLALVLGVITKTMPQVNVMTVGFTVKAIAGLALLAFSGYAVQAAAGDAITDALDTVRRWALKL